MKRKTINRIVKAKFDDWVKTIKDDKVQALVKQNTIMTGGAIASLLLNEQVNDFDFYFRNKETTVAVAEYYVKEFLANQKAAEAAILTDDTAVSRGGIQVPIVVRSETDRVEIFVQSAGVETDGNEETYKYFESEPATAGSNYINKMMQNRDASVTDHNYRYSPCFLSSNAITLTGFVQLVIRFYGEPDKIHENYDFVHCTNYWTSWNNEVVLNPKALECLLTRDLIYIGSKYPIASLCRIRKFFKRGFNISAGQLLKISMQLSKLNLDNYAVLREQLTGVDVAYFNQLIAALKEHDPEKVDLAYVMSLVDEIF
jgi:hypothetical protein